VAKRRRVTKKMVQETERKPLVPDLGAVEPEIDNDDCADDGLTVKQRLFVAAITGPARGNATRAAELAGYRADNRRTLGVTASENLKKPCIQEAIALALARKKADPEWARATLIDLAQSSLTNFVSVGEDGEPKLDFKKAAAAGALGQLKEFIAEILPGEDGEQKIIKCKIKVHDRTAAVGMLLRLHGLLRDDGTPPPGREQYAEADPALASLAPARGAIPAVVQPGKV
jgi:Terminase small subunit